MSKALVLLSGGQDSVTSLFWAKQFYDEVIAISIHYGQRHYAELDAARKVAELAKVKHRVLELPALALIGGSALLDDSQPLLGSGGLADAQAPDGLPTSFVPGRNMLFLATAAAVAVREQAKDIVTGVCQTDFSGYPDCRRDFIDAMEKAATLAMPSGSGPIRIITPLMYLTKAETVKLAWRLGSTCWEALGYSLTCYQGKKPGCGTCAACELRANGFHEAGHNDPASSAR